MLDNWAKVLQVVTRVELWRLSSYWYSGLPAGCTLLLYTSELEGGWEWLIAKLVLAKELVVCVCIITNVWWSIIIKPSSLPHEIASQPGHEAPFRGLHGFETTCTWKKSLTATNYEIVTYVCLDFQGDQKCLLTEDKDGIISNLIHRSRWDGVRPRSNFNKVSLADSESSCSHPWLLFKMYFVCFLFCFVTRIILITRG